MSPGMGFRPQWSEKAVPWVTGARATPRGAVGTGMAGLSLGHMLGGEGPRVQQWGWDRASMKTPFVEAL